MALANCRSDVDQCLLSCTGSSFEAAIMAIASWKDGSISPVFSGIRSLSWFLQMDGDGCR